MTENSNHRDTFTLSALHLTALEDFRTVAAALPAGDWALHRELAQAAAAAGFGAEVVQDYDNDAAHVSMTHTTRIVPADDITIEDEGIRTDFDPMGGSTSVEQFSPELPHGYFGHDTPLEDSPAPAEEAELGDAYLVPTGELKGLDSGQLTLAALDVASTHTNGDQLERGVRVASALHSGQTRANRADLPRTPYIEHPLRNMLRLTQWGVDDSTVLTAALLHDVPEDCADKAVATWAAYTDDSLSPVERTHQFIANEFGTDVSDIVQAVTNPPRAEGASQAERNDQYRQHVATAIEDPRAFLVKATDFADNAASLHHNIGHASNEWISKRIDKYRPIISDLAAAADRHLQSGAVSPQTHEAITGMLERTNARFIEMDPGVTGSSLTESVRSQAEVIASRLLASEPGLSAEDNAARLATCRAVVEDFQTRQDAAYANETSMYEPQVPGDPALERLVIDHQGDLHAALHSDDFYYTVQTHLDLHPTTVFVNDEDGERYEKRQPSLADLEFVQDVVDETRRRATEHTEGNVDLTQPPQPAVRKSSENSPVDAQAAEAMAQVGKNRPPAGVRAGLNNGSLSVQDERPGLKYDHGVWSRAKPGIEQAPF